MPYELIKTSTKALRDFGLSERWLQEEIFKDPRILGLGDLSVVRRERRQSSGGRLDFLMTDADSNKQYEIELMLGATNPSHIIRCIEYWDLERQRYPHVDHCAVLVAETITARFFNVIRLLNRSVPVIAIQFSAIDLGSERLALQFIRVLDESATYGPDDDVQTEEVVDENYWRTRASEESFSVAERIIDLVREVTPGVRVSYRSRNIGLGSSGPQFLWLRPGQRRHCHLQLLVGEGNQEDVIGRLDSDGLAANARGPRTIAMQLTSGDVSSHQAVLRELIDTYSKGSALLAVDGEN